MPVLESLDSDILDDLPASGSGSSSGSGEFTSTGPGRFMFMSNSSWEGPPAEQYHLYTVCALAVRCSHGSMPIASLHNPSKSAGLWLPYIAAKEARHWAQMPALIAEFFLNELKIPLERHRLLEGGESSWPFEKVVLHSVTRVQLPSGLFVTRLIYMGKWRSGSGTVSGSWVPCCQSTANVQWLPIGFICDQAGASKVEMKRHRNYQLYAGLVSRLWGSEVADYAGKLKSLYKSSSNTSSTTTSTTATPSTAAPSTTTVTPSTAAINVGAMTSVAQVSEITHEEVFKHLKGGQEDQFARFLAETKLNEPTVARLYSDFVQHCYPSTNMSYTSFYDYCQRIGLSRFFNGHHLKLIFKGMNYKVKRYIGFNEFLLGIAALEPCSSHCPPRYTCIFRYYDTNSDGYLERDDIQRMMEDISKASSCGGGATSKSTISYDSSSTNSRTTSTIEVPWKRLNYEQFVTEVKSGSTLSNTTILFRAPKSVLWMITETEPYGVIRNKNGPPFGRQLEGRCAKCRPKHYTLASHSVRLERKSHKACLNAVTSTTAVKVLGEEVDCASIGSWEPMNLVLRKHSADYIFKVTSRPNYVLEQVRKLSGYSAMKEDDKLKVKVEVTNALSVDVIRTLCDEAREIFTAEPRVLKVSTPSFVLGDIHGNINDLLRFEKQLWPRAPTAHAPNVLFLGDYVDRGEFSIEVVCYLFAMKILAPTQFHLLRGNHEMRGIQRSFTFERECLEKYASNGLIVFELFNNCFDLLPFSALIDESIFCAHGGIPCSLTKIEELEKITSPLPEPEQDAPAVWEILWNDPITNFEYKTLTEFMKKKDESGYLSNMKRSTAFFFSEAATTAFLRKNGLSHVFRAHEVIEEGYKFNHRGTVITVFSCSHYCNGNNKAAALLVDSFLPNREGFIKVISLDT